MDDSFSVCDCAAVSSGIRANHSCKQAEMADFASAGRGNALNFLEFCEFFRQLDTIIRFD